MGKPRGRPRTADGKRTVVSVRFSDAEAALIEQACGDTERSVWIRAAAVRAARASEVAADSEAHNREMGRRDAESRAYAKEPGFEHQCPPHPKARIHKGLCGACGRHVG